MNNRVLLVDDEPNILSSLRRQLSFKYDVTLAGSGEEGLNILKSQPPFAVVIADYLMPGMDGIHFLSLVWQMTPDTVRVILTGHGDYQVAMNAINEGNVFRFLAKPWSDQELLNNVNAAIEQYRLVTTEKELLEKTLTGAINVLIDILSMTNPLTFSRASRIWDLAGKLCRRLKVPNTWEVKLAAMLSQIGCVTIPPRILEKKNRASLSPSKRTVFSYPIPKPARLYWKKSPGWKALPKRSPFNTGSPPIIHHLKTIR